MNMVNTLWSSFPAFSAFQTLGLSILTLAFVLQLGKAALSAARGGRMDVVTPVVRIVFAAVLVSNMQAFGQSLISMIQVATESLLSGVKFSVFETAYQAVLPKAEELSALEKLAHVLSLKGLLSLSSVSLYLLVCGIKIFILDLLWPVFFSLVLALGMIAIPIGQLPGISSYGGWVKNVIEICLWPVVFAVISALICAAFSEYLKAAGNITLVNLVKTKSDGDSATAAAGVSILDMVKFFALCMTYLVALLFSPKIARFVTRGTPIGQAADAVVSEGLRLAVKAGGALLGAAGAGAFAAGGAASQGASSSMSAGASGSLSAAQGGAQGAGNAGSSAPSGGDGRDIEPEPEFIHGARPGGQAAPSSAPSDQAPGASSARSSEPEFVCHEPRPGLGQSTSPSPGPAFESVPPPEFEPPPGFISDAPRPGLGQSMPAGARPAPGQAARAGRRPAPGRAAGPSSQSSRPSPRRTPRRPGNKE